MRFLIETITGRKGYKSFETPEEYINFMAEKGHLVKELKEADLPYTDKPVKLPKISSSKGWSEVSDFGEVGEEAEKGESLIASTSKSVMKDEANMEMSKSSEKADKPEMGLGAEKGDIDMSDFKSFEYEEPKIKSSETKSEPKNDESKSEEKTESKEDKKESDKSSEKKENKEEKMNKHDKDIKECLKAAGVQLNEFFKFDSDNSKEDDSDDKDIEKLRLELHSLSKNSLFIRACINVLKKLGDNGGFGADRQSRESIERFINEVNKLIRKYTGKSEYAASSSTLKGLCEFIDSLPYEISSKIIDDLIQVVYNDCDSYVFNLICDAVAQTSKIAECLKASGTKPLNEFFKFNSGNSKEDDSDEYKTYKKYMNKEISDDEARSELKKQGYKGKTAKNLVKNAKTKRDTKLKEGIKDYLPRAGFIRDDDEDKDSRKMGVWGGQGTDEQLRKAKIIAKVKFANGDRMGRVTKEDLDNFEDYKAQYDEIYGSDELDEGNAMAGGDQMYDGARNPNTEDMDESFDLEIAECLRIANS